MPKSNLGEKQCLNCNNLYTLTSGAQKFCSKTCANDHANNHILIFIPELRRMQKQIDDQYVEIQQLKGTLKEQLKCQETKA